MPNPFFDNRTSPNNQTEPSNPLNDDSKEYSRGFSRFDYSRKFYNTLRYADITPHEVFEAGVCKDKIPFACKHQIRSHTLSDVLMSDIYMKKSYFAVDYRSFLPNNWSKIITHPVNGSDVDASEVNTIIINLPYILRNICDVIRDLDNSYIDDNINDSELTFSYIFRSLFILECFLSNGSLVSTLGFKSSSLWTNTTNSFDSLFDELISNLISAEFDPSLQIREGVLINFLDNPRLFIDTFRHHFEYKLIFTSTKGFSELLTFFGTCYDSISNAEYVDNLVYNYSRVCAYKMVTNNFYTNDKVDSIFDNKRFLDNQFWIFQRTLGGFGYRDNYEESFEDLAYFYYNGIRTPYDVLSGHIVQIAFELCFYLEDEIQTGTKLEETSFYNAQQFIYNLFSFDSSLRYGDYFTGSKTRPVAIGDTDLVETGEGVSTLDAIRRFSITRFLNQVGRVGPRMVDYVRGVLKGVPAPDVEIPRWLATVTSKVSGFEVENTANSQGSIVTLLKSTDSNYIYEVEVSEPCIILGVTTFEIPRVYCYASDKHNFHVDRFDMFNPFLENTGDQPIFKYERNLKYGTSNFAYTGRYMEYKQRFSTCSGGFVEFLKSWLFVTDNEFGDDNVDNATLITINSDFIRSKNTEMDRFYSTLTGYSLSSYFHFIVCYDNFVDANRQMQYNPQLM